MGHFDDPVATYGMFWNMAAETIRHKQIKF